ncbi:transposase [Cobetia sp. MC34]|nr:transposase [Cobetia sp. MC34]
MNQHVKRTQRDYTLAFKLAVVEQIEAGEMTYKQAQARYGIQGRSTVLRWLRQHGHQDWSSPRDVKTSGSYVMKEALPQTPEQRIKELEKQLELSQQKAQFFETVVNVLKKDYGISVKKLPGKPSRTKT